MSRLGASAAQNRVLSSHDHLARDQAHETVPNGTQDWVVDLHTTRGLARSHHNLIRAPQAPTLVQLKGCSQIRRSRDALAERDPILQGLAGALTYTATANSKLT